MGGPVPAMKVSVLSVNRTRGPSELQEQEGDPKSRKEKQANSSNAA